MGGLVQKSAALRNQRVGQDAKRSPDSAEGRQLLKVCRGPKTQHLAELPFTDSLSESRPLYLR
jgi:hypothetical protein